MDKSDRDRFASAYRILAEILERERPSDPVEDHLPFILGDLARRVFVGTEFDPPDEILEMVAHVIRQGDEKKRMSMAHRLREHADHLEELTSPEHDGE